MESTSFLYLGKGECNTNMNENDLRLLTETSERAKSNTNQIEEIKDEIKDIRNDQKAIYELSSSIKVLVHEVSNVKDDVVEIKKGQILISDNIDMKINEIDKRIVTIDEKGKVDFILYFKLKIIPFILGGGVIGGVIYIIEQFKK